MKKSYTKLVAAIVTLIISLTMIVSVSYAWMTISGSPEVNSIQVSIAGGKTILLAPDISKTVNGVTVHYPGQFGDTLNFSNNENYEYLKTIAGLTPVSTYDGLNWILPSYDEESGKLNDITEFINDVTLNNANIDKSDTGSYIYLDFWIVSPGSDYEVHVSTDSNTNKGSYLIGLPDVVKNDEGFSLVYPDSHAAATARVGFLTNDSISSSESMLSYTQSPVYNSDYKKLLGIFSEKGEAYSETENYKFTIYEPNATLHPSDEIADGIYVTTKPLQYYKPNNIIIESHGVSDRVCIQTTNVWQLSEDVFRLDQIFKTAVIEKQDLNASQAKNYFYNDYLQWQISSYINTGLFFRNTQSLYSRADLFGIVSDTDSLLVGGAADDVIVTTLSRNEPKRVRMFIWLEGQDVDCTNDSYIPKTDFALSIELSGASS